MTVEMVRNSLGTPETSLSGLSTLNVLRVDKSIFGAPSSVVGSNIGRNLVMIEMCMKALVRYDY